jgi:hypothetical protein
VKGSYRIGKLLKRFIRGSFDDNFLDPEISDPGRQQSKEFYSKNSQVPRIKPDTPLTGKTASAAHQQYLAYQKEVQAGKLVRDKNLPQSPGKVLKLPLDD